LRLSLRPPMRWEDTAQPSVSSSNGACAVETELGPRELLECLLAVERELGRERGAGPRWGPRTIDLDLLLYGDATVDEHGLTVPLAADVEREVAREYGVLAPGGGFFRRAIFVIDPKGLVRYRKVALVGLGFEDTGDLGSALEEARSAPAA